MRKAKKEEHVIVEAVFEENTSGAHNNRRVLAEAIALCKRKNAMMCVSAVARLARKVRMAMECFENVDKLFVADGTGEIKRSDPDQFMCFGIKTVLPIDLPFSLPRPPLRLPFDSPSTSPSFSPLYPPPPSLPKVTYLGDFRPPGVGSKAAVVSKFRGNLHNMTYASKPAKAAVPLQGKTMGTATGGAAAEP